MTKLINIIVVRRKNRRKTKIVMSSEIVGGDSSRVSRTWRANDTVNGKVTTDGDASSAIREKRNDKQSQKVGMRLREDGKRRSKMKTGEGEIDRDRQTDSFSGYIEALRAWTVGVRV